MGRRIQNKVIDPKRDIWTVIVLGSKSGLPVAVKVFDIEEDATDYASYKYENGFQAHILEGSMELHRFSVMRRKEIAS